ncbi:YraN family protein [Patescibacteria group bacterium]|nr:YraN family protein [Patescibacteria group bacterium]
MINNKIPKPPTEKQIIGRKGEDLACEYLLKEGFSIADRNYNRKWGELDIVAKKGKKIHFVEVKSVTREISDNNVIHETKEGYRPEDNMHPWKLQRLGRAVQSYLLEKDIPDNVDWQFDVVTVYIDENKRLHKVFMLADIVL